MKAFAIVSAALAVASASVIAWACAGEEAISLVVVAPDGTRFWEAYAESARSELRRMGVPAAVVRVGCVRDAVRFAETSSEPGSFLASNTGVVGFDVRLLLPATGLAVPRGCTVVATPCPESYSLDALASSVWGAGSFERAPRDGHTSVSIDPLLGDPPCDASVRGFASGHGRHAARWLAAVSRYRRRSVW